MFCWESKSPQAISNKEQYPTEITLKLLGVRVPFHKHLYLLSTISIAADTFKS